MHTVLAYLSPLSGGCLRGATSFTKLKNLVFTVISPPPLGLAVCNASDAPKFDCAHDVSCVVLSTQCCCHVVPNMRHQTRIMQQDHTTTLHHPKKSHFLKAEGLAEEISYRAIDMLDDKSGLGVSQEE